MSEIEFQEEDHSIRLKREVVIETPKKELIAKLSSCIADPDERHEFQLFCQRMEQMFGLEFRTRKEQLTELYDLFNPLGNSSSKIEEMSDLQVKEHEARFLEHFASIMSKSNFKALSDYEWNVATSSQYLFHLPTRIDKTQLDDELFVDTPYSNPSNTDLGRFYVVFRRGIGTDQKRAYFFKAKLDYIVQFCWDATFKKLWNRLRSCVGKSKAHGRAMLRTAHTSSDKYVSVKRIHISNSFELKDFFKRFTLQDPTFDHTIIVYRKVTELCDAKRKKDFGIYIKHYKEIPMADMELVLPAKKHPRLPLQDWIKLIVFALICVAAIVSALRRRSQAAIVIGIVVAFVSYAMKIYVTFNMNVLEYERDINNLMAGKLLDCGHGTLLHVLDEAIQQEVKEAIIAYFVLMRNPGGTISEEELRHRCNDLIESYFENGTSEFEVKDAVDKLRRLGIIMERDERIKYVLVREANEKLLARMMESLCE
ncbi:uncharacterized protein LOC112343500 isoform X2 [Selaginella moellendorffii]|uniref:uncharacterized protein LOC112343500 isoform X2 n=1 Tax=Selaginella moellendorffii TaxID=88036 RepID=UPI000D1CE77D|nr:uncharacterized protein LOC112343500 isoform X2 [Selaginella moellendorffii]|eukprot:XP_024522847.1 uncharacterized protein LOC112343500 isoform X2 [Selaginella moellendorffii]